MRQTILAALFLLAINVQANAQSDDLFWTARVYGAEALPPEPRTVALYGPVSELRIVLTMTNEGRQAILVDTGGFVESVAAELLESQRPIPAQVVWEPTFRGRLDDQSIPWAAGVQHMIEPDASIVWTLRFQPGERGLGVGQYTIGIDLRKALQSSFFKLNGERWMGRSTQQTALKVLIRSSTATVNDVSRSEQARGRIALKERRYNDALAAFFRAAAVAPPDMGLSSDLGLAYLGMKVYPEAIKWLERASSPTSQDGHSALPELLALAYVGIGDEATAARILRSRGKSAEESAREIARLREVANSPGDR